MKFIDRLSARHQAAYILNSLKEITAATRDYCMQRHDQPDGMHPSDTHFNRSDMEEEETNEVTAAKKGRETPRDGVPKYDKDVKEVSDEINKQAKELKARILANLKAKRRTPSQQAEIDKYGAEIRDGELYMNRHEAFNDICERMFESKTYHDKFHPRLSTGNGKLANEGIAPFSLPEGYTCPGAGACKTKHCYAKTGPMAWDDSVIKRWVNYYASKRPEFPAEMHEVVGLLHDIKTPVTSKDWDRLSGYTVKRKDKKSVLNHIATHQPALKKNKKLMAYIEKLQDGEQCEISLSDFSKEKKRADAMNAKIKHDIIALTPELKGKARGALVRKMTTSLLESYEDRVDHKGNPITWMWDAIRIHDAGDFHSAEYVRKWVEVIKKNPKLKFYAYTKSFGSMQSEPGLSEAMKELEALPNMKIIQSAGSTSDPELDPSKPHAIIFETREQARAAGYSDSYNYDRTALDSKNKTIGLAIHGPSETTHTLRDHLKDVPKTLSNSVFTTIEKNGAPAKELTAA